MLGICDSLTITATASGAADMAGYAEVFSAAFGLITIDNFSTTDEVAVTFLLDFTLFAEASVDDSQIEDAVSGVTVDVFSFSGGVDVEEFVYADGLFGPFDPSFADSFSFTLIIGADDFDEIELIVDAGSLAEVILAPGGLVFLLAIRFRPVVNPS